MGLDMRSPFESPASARRAERRSAMCLRLSQVGSALSADGVRPATLTRTYPSECQTSIRGALGQTDSVIGLTRRRHETIAKFVSWLAQSHLPEQGLESR